MTLLLASITPVIIFLYLIFRKDRNKEPIGILSKCFFFGFLSIPLSLLLSIPLSTFEGTFRNVFIDSFFDAFFLAAIPEEIAKFLILYLIVWKSKHFDEHYDGIIYAVFVSLGFALIENIVYVFEHGMKTAFFRAILAVPGHGFFGVAMGYFLSRARFTLKESERKNLLVLALAVPILLHGTYDFILMFFGNAAQKFPGLGILFIIVFTYFVIYLWKLGLRKIRKSFHHDNQINNSSST